MTTMIAKRTSAGDRSGVGASRRAMGGLDAAGLARMARASLLAFLSVVLLIPSAFAAEEKKKKTDADYQFSERNLKKIQKMLELYEAEDIDGATKILLSINTAREKPYGRAMIYQFLGSFAVADEKLEDALKYYDLAVKQDGLPPEDQLRAMFTLGQIQTMMGRYDDAIVSLENWMKIAPKPPASSYYTLAATYYQAGRPKDAIEPAKKAVELASAPQENWYRLLLSLYLDAERYDEAVALLDDIILAFPNKVYWTQLAAVYNQMEKTDKSLAVQQLAKYEGFITEDKDLTRMAQMLMVQGLPHRGAEVMKQGLDDGSIKPTKLAYQTYSDTLLQSREWALALEPLAKAAELAEDGSMWVRHAQVNLQLGDWGAARESLNRAFQKGHIPDEGQAHVLFGIAAANEKEWDAAEASFKRAGKFPGTADVSVKWLAYVERERFRFASPEEQARMAAERAAREAAANPDGASADGKADAKADGKAKEGQPAGTTTQAAADAKAATTGAAPATSKN